MAHRRRWWEKIADALGAFADELFDSSAAPQSQAPRQKSPVTRARRTFRRGRSASKKQTQEKLQEVSRETSKERSRSGGLIEQATTPEELEGRRREVLEQILNWFPADGHYTAHEGRRMYLSSQGWSYQPTNPHTVSRNIARMDEFEIDLVLTMDREDFRQMASVNPHFYYH